MCSVLVMGVVTTIYSAKGGMKAVVLTEVIQGLTMVVGISLIVILAITGLPHGWKSFVEVDTHFQKFNLGIWSLDYTMPIIWILILTPLFNKLAFAADAPTVQRVFATPLKDVRKLALMFLCFQRVHFLRGELRGHFGVRLFSRSIPANSIRR